MFSPTIDSPGAPGSRIKSVDVGFEVFPGEPGIVERSTEEERSQSGGSGLSAKVTKG